MKKLHKIISHKCNETKEIDHYINNFEGNIEDKEEESNQHYLKLVMKKTSLSLRTNSKMKKTKVKIELQQPIRVLPKREVKLSNK